MSGLAIRSESTVGTTGQLPRFVNMVDWSQRGLHAPLVWVFQYVESLICFPEPVLGTDLRW